MIQFYCPDIEENPVLPESDSRHCTKVLRMGQGDELEIVDGKGHRFRCVIIDPHSKRCVVEILEKEPVEKQWAGEITIAVAPTKHMDRMEWLVEKLTEIGVDRIVPIRCMRSERKEVKQERLEKIAVSAMKQSLKAQLPEVAELTPFRQALDEAVKRGDTIFFAYCDSEAERLTLAREMKTPARITVFIGPEGDFSPEEVSAAKAAGTVPVTLGPNRLRTETAALVACDTYQILSQKR